MTKLDRLRELLEKATPEEWFVGSDDAPDCPDHANSGLALIDTGRVSDFTVARLLEWNNADLIVYLHNNADAMLRAVEAGRKLRHYLHNIQNDIAPGLPASRLFAEWDAALKELEEGT